MRFDRGDKLYIAGHRGLVGSAIWRHLQVRGFDPQSSHVLPALIRRFHEAKERGASEVLRWGSGTPRRGDDVAIRELAEIVAEVVGYQSEVVQDTTKPDGTPRKLLDVTRINDLGCKATVPLRDDIASTYQGILDQRPAILG